MRKSIQAVALSGGEEPLPATVTKGKQRNSADYTINIMESDEFLHLLSEEESSKSS